MRRMLPKRRTQPMRLKQAKRLKKLRRRPLQAACPNPRALAHLPLAEERCKRERFAAPLADSSPAYR